MQALSLSLLLRIMLLALYFFFVCKASDCNLHESLPHKVAYTITVDKSGKGNFTTVQGAIDSIPVRSNQWIRIELSPGKYREKVDIPVDRPCVFLDGGDKSLTSIEWSDHEVTSNSSTFSSYADNVVLKGITFRNNYNLEVSTAKSTWKQAVAARIRGNKTLIYQSGFEGVQDTFWDQKGDHYILESYIEGSLDFLFGTAKSIYENCTISINVGKLAPGIDGFITAQKKEWPTHNSGFVFKHCLFTGTGKAYFGRAWGPYSTVIIAYSKLDDVIVPEGWNSWNYGGHEANLTYAEYENEGPGADTSKRVNWEKKLDPDQLKKFLDLSFINGDGWLANVPISVT